VGVVPRVDALDGFEGMDAVLKKNEVDEGVKNGGGEVKQAAEGGVKARLASRAAHGNPGLSTSGLPFDPLARRNKNRVDKGNKKMGKEEGSSALEAELMGLMGDLLKKEAGSEEVAGGGGAKTMEETLAALSRHLGTEKDTFDPSSTLPLGDGPENLLSELLGESDASSSLVDGIMQQLLSKEVLYQPMKDIGSKYPAWLMKHKQNLTDEEYRMYEKQLEYIDRICHLYESKPDDVPQLMMLLQEVRLLEFV